jgi:hypothetical protein
MLSCKAVTVDQLPHGSYGNVYLRETTVKNHTETTTGNFCAKSSILHDIDITSGNVAIINSTLDGKIYITSGSITFKNSKLVQNAKISAAWIGLKNTHAKSILFNSDSNKNVCLNLYNKSTIDGDVTFINNKGLIYIENGSKITGAIHGATLIKNECEN